MGQRNGAHSGTVAAQRGGANEQYQMHFAGSGEGLLLLRTENRIDLRIDCVDVDVATLYSYDVKRKLCVVIAQMCVPFGCCCKTKK